MSLPAPYYQDDAVTIYHGDCREILPTLPAPDFVLTDPPYYIHAGACGGAFGNRDHLANTGGFTDGGCDYQFLAGFESWACFCSLSQLADLLNAAGDKRRCLLTWHKPNPVPTCNAKYLPDAEYIVHRWAKGRLFGEMRHKATVFSTPCGGKETAHPNEKPVGLMSWLVTVGSQSGELILDPFAGSGTTGRAAKDLGRKAVLIEREERYCEIAARRMAQEVLPL